MAERRVSVDGTTYDLTPPFLVIATQNPVDHEGTFPLPEAQLDRFLVRLSLGYPTAEEEASMLARLQLKHPIDDLKAVVTADEILQCQQAVRNDPRRRQAQQIHRRADPAYPGASGRLARRQPSGLAGALPGRRRRWRQSAGIDYITPDDIKRLAPAILGHRIILKPESRLAQGHARSVVVEELLDTGARPDQRREGHGLMRWFLAIVAILVDRGHFRPRRCSPARCSRCWA